MAIGTTKKVSRPAAMGKTVVKTDSVPHVCIKHVERGDSFSGVYYVEQIYTKVARNGNKYSDILLRDKSGSAYCRFWGVIELAVKGDFVEIEAVVEEYMGNPQIVIQGCPRKVDIPSDLSDYVPEANNLELLEKAFNDIIADVHTDCDELDAQTCVKLLDSTFGGKTIGKFLESPCSVLPHYGVKGGLLAHTVRMTEIARDIGIRHNLDRETCVILMTASLLHKIGAIDSYEVEDCMPIETTKGILVGCDNLTIARVTSSIRRIKQSGNGLDGEVVLRVLHAIASHNSEYVKPMTKEALVLAEAYKADMSVVEAMDFIAQDSNPDDEFTAYDPVLGRRYYRGKSY